MMYQKLQHNLDIIQFLLKNASLEQLTWRENGTNTSLAEIIGHLRDRERGHACFQISDALQPDQPGLVSGVKLSSGGSWQSTAAQPGAPARGASPGTWPARFSLQVFDLKQKSGEKDQPDHDNLTALAEYISYRQQTIARLQAVPPANWHGCVGHEQFGRITLAELVQRIDAHDRAQIRQIEQIIQAMPLNPLLARALAEISDYHRRYQPYLAQATTLLDIGVGTGLALRHLMQENPHLTFAGVDVRDLRLPGITVPLQVYDGDMLPFMARQFDVSLLFYVLHHCQNPHRLLDEAMRVTRQKLIIIEEFDRPGADPTSLDLTERQNHRALGLPADLPYQLFGKTELEAMFRERHLIELEQQLLPSKTARPVQKYLYVLGIRG